VPALCLLLAFLLVVSRDFAEGAYPLFSVVTGLGVALAFVATGLGCLAAGLLAAVPGFRRARAGDARRAGILSAALLLALCLFIAPLRGSTFALAQQWGSGAGILPLALLLVGALAWFLLRLPRDAALNLLPKVLALSLASACCVAWFETALARLRPDVEMKTATEAGSAQPPENFYYIVLDALSGLPAYPPDIPGASASVQEWRARYAEAQFENYERVFSNALWTRQSLYSVLDGADHSLLEAENGEAIRVPRTRFFEDALKRGYRLRIHQSSYIDFCSSLQREYPETECVVYPLDSLSAGPYDAEDLARHAVALLDEVVELPELVNARWLYSAKNSLAAFRRIIDEAPSLPRGQVVFAHLMLPHEPFVFDAQCELRRNRSELRRETYYGFVPAGAAVRRWEAYVQQADCAHRQVMDLVSALRDAGRLEGSTLLIHGDHGSRIALGGHFGPRARISDVRSFLDFYASFFALKRGDFSMAKLPEAGRKDWVSLSALLAGLTGHPPPPHREELRAGVLPFVTSHRVDFREVEAVVKRHERQRAVQRLGAP